MIPSRFGVLVLSCLLTSASFAAVPDVPTLPPAALRAGERATVRTVFAGDSIETFDAEILGVLRGGRAEGDMILARATSPRVVEMGVAQGMSGSPVYVDGRLIGALSSGWSFSREPIFGITPIGEMLDVLDRPERRSEEGTAGPVGLDAGTPAPRVRELAWSDEPPAAMPPAAAVEARPSTLALPLAAGGLSPRAFDYARDLFAPLGFTLTPGGHAPPDSAPPRLEPGSAVAVDVLRGDLNFSAIGTVTYVDGDRVLLFGHPFFQSGDVRMPLSTAHIVGILPSLASSFKLGVPGTPVGVATQDRRTAVGGRLGGVPRLMPFSVRVTQPGADRRYHFQTIEDRALLPQLLGAAVMNSVLEAGGGGAQQSVSWTLEAWRGKRTLRIEDVAAGDAPITQMTNDVLAPLRFLYNNPFERFALDSARVDVRIEAGRHEWTVRSADLTAAAVRPGADAHVRVELESWRGASQTLVLSLPVPRGLPAGRYEVWLGGGDEYDHFVAQRLPWRYRPVSVDDAWQRLEALKPSNALYASLWAHAPEVTSDGQDMPELPLSALALLASPQAAGDLGRRSDWALVSEQSRAFAGALRGELVLELDVDPKAP